MNANQAFNQWANGFGVPAYAEGSAPTNADLPYISYSFGLAGFGEEYTASLNVWGDESEAEINAIARLVSSELGLGGTIIQCDGGAMWLKKGSPFVNSINGDAKARLINVTVENLIGE